MLDLFLAKYIFKMRSQRWCIYLFWHFLCVALVNSWLLYKRHYQLLGFPVKKVLSQRRFQAQVASSLILVKIDRKRGKLSESPVPLSKRKVFNLPCADVRKDKFAHCPKKSDKRGRCKLCEINNTNTVCSKCNVRLRFVEGRNCFVNFHN